MYKHFLLSIISNDICSVKNSSNYLHLAALIIEVGEVFNPINERARCQVSGDERESCFSFHRTVTWESMQGLNKHTNHLANNY